MAASQEQEVKPAGTSFPEIMAQQAHIMSVIDQNGGELTPEIEEALNNVDLAVADKVEAYIVICDRFEMESDYWSAKAKKYSKMAKAASAVRERLRDRVKNTMIALGFETVSGVDRRFQLQNGKDSITIDSALLPKDYKKEEIVVSPDRARIEMDLELGIEIPGVKVEKTKILRDYANSTEKSKKTKKEKV